MNFASLLWDRLDRRSWPPHEGGSIVALAAHWHPGQPLFTSARKAPSHTAKELENKVRMTQASQLHSVWAS